MGVSQSHDVSQIAKFMFHTPYDHPNRKKFAFTPIACVNPLDYQLGICSKTPIIVQPHYTHVKPTCHGFHPRFSVDCCAQKRRSSRCSESRFGYCLWCQFTCTSCRGGVLSLQARGEIENVKPKERRSGGRCGFFCFTRMFFFWSKSTCSYHCYWGRVPHTRFGNVWLYGDSDTDTVDDCLLSCTSYQLISWLMILPYGLQGF